MTGDLVELDDPHAEILRLHERLGVDRQALKVAVTGLRELEDHYADAAATALADNDDNAQLYEMVRLDLSTLLDRVGLIR